MTFAGRLRHRVALQQPVTTKDSYGQDVVTWTHVATVWASLEPIRGREYFEAQQHGNETTVRIVMRAQGSLIKPTWRVLHGSDVYEIVSVIDPQKRGDYLELMARKSDA